MRNVSCKMLMGYLHALRWAQWEILVRIEEAVVRAGQGGQVVLLVLVYGCWWKTWGWKDKAPLLASLCFGVPSYGGSRVSESMSRQEACTGCCLSIILCKSMLGLSYLQSFCFCFYHLVIWQRGVWILKTGNQSSLTVDIFLSIWFWPEILVKKVWAGKNR